jgi:hypothetical protein
MLIALAANGLLDRAGGSKIDDFANFQLYNEESGGAGDLKELLDAQEGVIEFDGIVFAGGEDSDSEDYVELAVGVQYVLPEGGEEYFSQTGTTA